MTAPLPAGSPAARIVALADACVLCGLCLPHCPTYRLDRSEGESPRGRIMLMKGLAEARIGPEPAAVAHLDHCLACRHCERVCPAQVQYGELLWRGRAAQRSALRPGWKQRAAEWLLPRRAWLRAALTMAGLLRALPGPWRRIPPTTTARFDPVYRPVGEPRGRVALFLGCLGAHFDAAPARAAIRLLTRLGFEVVLPPDQTCCGALHRHAGASAAADALAARNRAAFAQAAPLAILTLASGCHESIAHGFEGVAVRDVGDFLADDAVFAALALRPAPPGMRVALHLPCTQRNLLRNGERVAALLTRIPNLELQRLPDAECCGAAGSQMLTDPPRADALREPLLHAIQTQGAPTLCSANVGCRMHLEVGVRARGMTTRLRHPIELLAEHLP